MNDKKSEWEYVAYYLDKVKIPGGWIYRHDSDEGASICFVPEPDKCCYHNEYVVKCCESCLKEKNNGSD